MAGRLAGLRILIAEDEWLLADLLVDLVKLHGGTVVGPVTNEPEALAIMDGTAIDAAVLDVVLASGPCYVLAETLMERDVPVILTTGHDISEIPDDFAALPIFSKPFHMETLVDRIDERRRA